MKSGSKLRKGRDYDFSHKLLPLVASMCKAKFMYNAQNSSCAVASHVLKSKKKTQNISHIFGEGALKLYFCMTLSEDFQSIIFGCLYWFFVIVILA